MRSRPYQQYSIDAALSALQNPACKKTTMLIAPTGAGKTFMLSKVVDELLKLIGDKKRALVFVHRNKVNEQNKEAFEKICGRKTCLFAGENKSLSGQVVFGMVQTLAQVYTKLPAFDVLVIDEFHHSAAESYIDIINDQRKKNPNLYVFGVTATPNRGDKKGLAAITNNFCAQILIQDLVELSYLVPLEYKAVDLFEIEHLSKVSKPDYFEMTTKELIKEIALIPDRKKIVLFAGNRAQMAYIETELNAHNIKSTSIHSEMHQSEIRKNTRLFEKSDTRILLNIDIATEGYDYQPIDCVILMRKVGNKGYYSQMVGRGLRTIDQTRYPGAFKKNCLLLDFGGNARRYGQLYEKPDLIGKEVYLPGLREIQEKKLQDEQKELPILIREVNEAVIHAKGEFETFVHDGAYIKGICGKGRSLFIIKDQIYFKTGSDVKMLSDEKEAIGFIEHVFAEDVEFFESLKNQPIEQYQMKLLIDNFDLVGCSKYRASVLLNFLAVRGMLCA